MLRMESTSVVKKLLKMQKKLMEVLELIHQSLQITVIVLVITMRLVKQ